MAKPDIVIFTDGAVPNNQSKMKNKGGVGVFFGDNDPRNISLTLEATATIKVTNQVCETLACIKAIETLVSTQRIKNRNIIIKTDSMYLVNSMTTWAKNWEKNNWVKADGKPVQNLELIKKLYYLSRNINVTYIHVKAHTKAPPVDSIMYSDYYGNYMADKLATSAATSASIIL
jgi:ribonuclease HI